MTQGKKSATTGYDGRVASNITSAIRHDVDHFEILRFTSYSSQNDIKSILKLKTHTDDARRSHDQRNTHKVHDMTFYTPCLISTQANILLILILVICDRKVAIYALFACTLNMIICNFTFQEKV